MIRFRLERVGCSVSGRAASARRTQATFGPPAETSPSNILRSNARLHNAREQGVAKASKSDDTGAAPSVLVVEPAASVAGTGPSRGEDGPQQPQPQQPADPDAPLQLSEQQLESRRMSNLGASTSSTSSSSLDAGDASSWARRPQRTTPAASFPSWPTGPTSAAPGPRAPAAAFPATPRPGGPALVSPAGPSSGPLTSSQVPPVVAQLYADDPVSRDISQTAASVGPLARTFDILELEVPAAPGAGTNTQRVYKTATGKARAAGAAAAAGPRLTRRRASVWLLDLSESLLARDEAVRTELLGRTWQDLLQFEERLGSTAGSAGAGAAVSAGGEELQGDKVQGGQADPESFEEVLSWLKQQAVEMRTQEAHQEGQQEKKEQGAGGSGSGSQEQAPEQASQRNGTGVVRPAAETSLMRAVRGTTSLRDLAQLYADRRPDFTPGALAEVLRQMSCLSQAPKAFSGRNGHVFLQLWQAVVRQMTYVAPDLTGPEAVKAVRALATMPVFHSGRMRWTLQAVSRILALTKPNVLPAAAAQARGGGGAAGAGPGANRPGGLGGMILNTSEVAVTSRKRARGPGGAAGAGGLGTAGGSGTVLQTALPGVPPVLRVPVPSASASLTSTAGSMDEAEVGPSAQPNAAAAAAIQPSEYVQLVFSLGSLNKRARPMRMSLRLPPAIPRGLLLGLYPLLGYLKPGDYGRLAHGLSLLCVQPPAQWMYGFYVTSARVLSDMTVRDLTTLMYGVCRLGVRPPQPWVEAYLQAMYSHMAADAAARAMKTTVTQADADARDGAAGGGAVAEGRGAGGDGAAALSSSSSSASSGDDKQDRVDGGSLGLILHALGRIRYKPRSDWLAAHLEATNRALAARALRPTEISHVFRGLAMLDVRPGPQVMAAMWDASGEMLARGDFPPAQMANLAWSLGLLKARPPLRWLRELLSQALKARDRFRPYHSRRLLAALEAFGFRLRELRGWYRLLDIPLEESPQYQLVLAMRRKQRVKQALEQLQRERELAKQLAERQVEQEKQAEGQQEETAEGLPGKKKKKEKKTQARKRSQKVAKAEEEVAKAEEEEAMKEVRDGRRQQQQQQKEGLQRQRPAKEEEEEVQAVQSEEELEEQVRRLQQRLMKQELRRVQKQREEEEREEQRRQQEAEQEMAQEMAQGTEGQRLKRWRVPSGPAARMRSSQRAGARR